MTAALSRARTWAQRRRVPRGTSRDLIEISNAMAASLGVTSAGDTWRSMRAASSEGRELQGPRDRQAWHAHRQARGIPWDHQDGRAKLYSDTVMMGANKSWLLNHRTALDVVMEGLPNAILDKPSKITNGRADRRIGHDLARIGLPKKSFLYKNMRGSAISTTRFSEAMRMLVSLDNRSSMGAATLVISLAVNAKVENGNLIPTSHKNELVVQLRSFLPLS
ncbi:hypothetical protein F5883DRAFT_720945 [Diaporthe sp. PMI_573]|nr:hypothetical protein F5883DRAFT_720945 [Diaporthaceae sp. PMI_573]